MTDITGRPLRTVNTHPVPTAAQLEEAAQEDRCADEWQAKTGECDQSMGGAYELSQIIVMHRQAATLARHGGYKLVMALWDKQTNTLVNNGRPVETRFGFAYPNNTRGGKVEWVSSYLSDKTLAKRGYEWVGAWIKAS